MADINDILARRTDLSTFLVHLTRDADDGSQSAAERLELILQKWKLRATTPMGPAVPKLKDDADLATQRCICFTETPLEYTKLLTEEIDSRKCRFQPYGIAITKKQARYTGVNPIWYMDISPSGLDWLTKPVERMIDNAIKAGKFKESNIAKLTPFMEQMGSGAKSGGNGGYRKEFWWEREWRRVGDMTLPRHVIALCPEDETDRFKQAPPDPENYWPDDRIMGWSPVSAVFLDPRWSLERMIASLTGFDRKEIEII